MFLYIKVITQVMSNLKLCLPDAFISSPNLTNLLQIICALDYSEQVWRNMR